MIKRIALGVVRLIGQAAKVVVVGLMAVSIAGGGIVLADYALTQGVGTTFASIVVSAKHYAAYVMCDPTAGETQCQAVNGSGQASTVDANGAAILTAVQAAIPAGTNVIGFTSNDPCQVQAHVFKPIAIATGTTTNLITGTSAKKLYICQITLTTGIANNVTVIEGTTGATCGAATAGIFGGTTTGTGFVFSANGGVALGNGGYAIGQTATNANDLCIITSAAGPLAGGITYAVQ